MSQDVQIEWCNGMDHFNQSIDRGLACFVWRGERKVHKWDIRGKIAFDCVNFTVVVHKHCFLGWKTPNQSSWRTKGAAGETIRIPYAWLVDWHDNSVVACSFCNSAKLVFFSSLFLVRKQDFTLKSAFHRQILKLGGGKLPKCIQKNHNNVGAGWTLSVDYILKWSFEVSFSFSGLPLCEIVFWSMNFTKKGDFSERENCRKWCTVGMYGETSQNSWNEPGR